MHNTMQVVLRQWSGRMCAHLLLRELQNYNLLLNNQQQENVGSHEKKTSHIQGQRRSPNKMQSHLESNPIPTRDSWRAQTNKQTKKPQKSLCAAGPRDPTETESDLPLSVSVSPAEAQVSSSHAGTGAVGAAELGGTARAISPLRGGSH